MPLKRIQARVDLLKKLISALKEAQSSWETQPLELLKKVLKERANLKIEKTRHKKPGK
jgi:hypothetical protein